MSEKTFLPQQLQLAKLNRKDRNIRIVYASIIEYVENILTNGFTTLSKQELKQHCSTEFNYGDNSLNEIWRHINTLVTGKTSYAKQQDGSRVTFYIENNILIILETIESE